MTLDFTALQAEFHGFGLSLNPARLDPVDKRPVQDALKRLLHDPSFEVIMIPDLSKEAKGQPRCMLTQPC